MATISCTPATRSVVQKDANTQMTMSQNVDRTSKTQVMETFDSNESQMPEGNDHVKKQKSKHVKSKHVKTGGAAATVGNEPTQNLRPSDSPACEPARSDSPASGPMSGSPSAKGVPKGGGACEHHLADPSFDSPTLSCYPEIREPVLRRCPLHPDQRSDRRWRHYPSTETRAG